MSRPSIYLAGSSNDMDRVMRWRDRLVHDFSGDHVRIADRPVVQAHWLDAISQVGVSNPGDASRMDRSRWALHDLICGVGVSSLLWLMRPPDGQSSHGAYFECGFAYAKQVPTLVSGPRKTPSTFDALALEFERDEQAFDWILRYFQIVPESVVVPAR